MNSLYSGGPSYCMGKPNSIPSISQASSGWLLERLFHASITLFEEQYNYMLPFFYTKNTLVGMFCQQRLQLAEARYVHVAI